MATRLKRPRSQGIDRPEVEKTVAPIVARRNPLITDRMEVGTPWVNRITDEAFVLTSVANNSAVWRGVGGTTVTLSNGLQVIDGSGDPNGTVTAPQGSLFLRSDGVGTNSRAYINTDSGTTWTAVTTAA